MEKVKGKGESLVGLKVDARDQILFAAGISDPNFGTNKAATRAVEAMLKDEPGMDIVIKLAEQTRIRREQGQNEPPLK